MTDERQRDERVGLPPEADWRPQETSKHQDHVIAHVLGATVLGYFVADETLHLLLDMGFIWTIYADGEMGLAPEFVAIDELEETEEERGALRAEAQRLRDEGRAASHLTRLTGAPVECLIEEVEFLARGEERRLMLRGAEANLIIESSLANGTFRVCGAEAS